eukprot:3832428-Pyramimonas_sp.AAC.1
MNGFRSFAQGDAQGLRCTCADHAIATCARAFQRTVALRCVSAPWCTQSLLCLVHEPRSVQWPCHRHGQ